MQSDLDLLIELYESEKSFLERCIKDYIDEFEYQFAFFHSEALSQVNSKIRILNSFKGPLYSEKEKLERMISMMPKIEDYDLEKFMRARWEERIKDQEGKVDQIGKQKIRRFYDSQEIDDALFGIFEGKFKKFRLLLNKEDDFYLDFELKENHMLIISIELENILNSDNIYREDDLNDSPFKGLGFKLSDDGNYLAYRYNMTRFKDAISIKMLLSRIVYDIYIGGFDEAAIIIWG
jgi:hypothetical protein